MYLHLNIKGGAEHPQGKILAAVIAKSDATDAENDKISPDLENFVKKRISKKIQEKVLYKNSIYGTNLLERKLTEAKTLIDN